jgi:hypothetical protein
MMATSEFGKAFAAARKAGDKSFEFNGKKYTTKTAEDVSKEKKGAMEKAQRGRSDIMRDLTKAERNMPAGTSELAKQKIAEAKRKATEEYATAEKAEGMKGYKSRAGVREGSPMAPKTTVSKPAAKKPYEPEKVDMSFRKGGSINGIAKRGLTKCKTV